MPVRRHAGALGRVLAVPVAPQLTQQALSNGNAWSCAVAPSPGVSGRALATSNQPAHSLLQPYASLLATPRLPRLRYLTHCSPSAVSDIRRNQVHGTFRQHETASKCAPAVSSHAYATCQMHRAHIPRKQQQRQPKQTRVRTKPLVRPARNGTSSQNMVLVVLRLRRSWRGPLCRSRCHWSCWH